MNSLEKPHIQRFRILELLGVGGMGEVYLAEDERLGRKVAIKILAEKFSENSNRLGRFIREAKSASALNHPNIITIYEIGEFENKHFIATEFIEGDTLQRRLRGKPLEFRFALDIAIQIASALDAAHNAGIVHRDIKPENVMIRPDGFVKILDFGIVKLTEKQTLSSTEGIADEESVKTQPGIVIGTPQYMSPEQSRGLTVDERTDIWSLGIVLYQMITGVLPFQGPTIADVLVAILEREVKPLEQYLTDFPSEIQQIVNRALSKSITERYQTVSEMAEEMKNLKRRTDFEVELEKNNALEAANTIEMHGSGDTESAGLSTSTRINKDKLLLTEFTNLTGDPVFDGTLRTALAVSLEQSPFLDIFPDVQVRNTLRLMGRLPDESVTPALGSEICLRKGLKAYITGTISSFGSIYVLTLEAVNARTGESIARKLEQAESKELILKVLGTAAAGLREKLGESLSSIEQFDAQFEYTTSSLEALKIYSLGVQEQRNGRWLAAIAFYKQAIALDPNFSSAYVGACSSYSNTNQPKLAAQYAAKAFELQEGVSELEKLRISHFYYAYVTGELDKRIETLEVMKRIYPRVKTTLNNLADCYMQIGQFEKAIKTIRDSLKETPHSAVSYDNLAMSLLSINNFEESKKTCHEAVAEGLENIYFHVCLYLVAYIENDASAMNDHLEWMREQPDEYVALDLQARTAAAGGQFWQASEFSQRSIELAEMRRVSGVAGNYCAEQAVRESLLTIEADIDNGIFNLKIKALTAKALLFERNPVIFPKAAFALAFGGFTNEADELLTEMLLEFPKNTLVKNVWAPVIRATLELRRGLAKEALHSLDLVKQFGSAAEFHPQYIRALAFLKLGSKKGAIDAFEKILAHRGESPLSLIYPLARLGLAEAKNSKEDYEKFLSLWKVADEDLTLLMRAKGKA